MNKTYRGEDNLADKNRTKKLLLLGGGYAEIPLIKAAQKQGYYVITTGNQREGLGHNISDKFIEEDFSDKEKMLQLARDNHVSAICSGCNDFALLSTAYVAEQLGFKGHDSYETSLTLHHKDRYRSFAEKYNIATPKSVKCYRTEEIEILTETFTYPVIVKPVDLSGGKGIKHCYNLEELKEAFVIAMSVTRIDYVIIEEFLEGTNHGFSAMIQDEKVTFYFVDNEQYFLNKYLVSGAITPTSVSKEVVKKIIMYAEKISQILNLVDGILHIQFILDKSNEPTIIEICRRAPGDLYIRLVELATGFDYPTAIMNAETGVIIPPYKFFEPQDYWIRHCIMGKQAGRIKSISISDQVKDTVVEKMIWGEKGQYVEQYLTYKAGIIFLRFYELDKLENFSDVLNELITIEFEI